MFPVALSDVERALYQTRLTEARLVRHQIATGKSVKRFIDQNGEQIEYNAAKLGDLDKYILELEGLLNPCVAAYQRKRPIGFTF